MIDCTQMCEIHSNTVNMNLFAAYDGDHGFCLQFV